MIKAVIFDLDLCIFDTRSLGDRILEPVLAPLHASSVPEEIQREIDRVLWTTNLEDVIELFGIPDAVAARMREEHGRLVVPETARTYGDEDCIRGIRAYRILVTSGYQAWQQRKIERLGVAELFDDVIIDAVDAAKARKGKKSIFKELLAQHAWQSREVLVVGDNPLSELKAGRELGMVTVQTLRPTVVKADGFDHYVSSMQELLPLIRQLQG